MTKNTYVKIIASPELSRMKLGGLAGRRGLVVEDLSGEDRKNKGRLVLLEEGLHGWSLSGSSRKIL